VIRLIAYNEHQCTDTAVKFSRSIYDVAFPTAFTPNTSGPSGGKYDPWDLSNDVFYPKTKGVEDFVLTIFNRWGEMIFQSKDINVGWDGYFRGQLWQQ
jgi:gliding motility-associated-like protein